MSSFVNILSGILSDTCEISGLPEDTQVTFNSFILGVPLNCEVTPIVGTRIHRLLRLEYILLKEMNDFEEGREAISVITDQSLEEVDRSLSAYSKEVAEKIGCIDLIISELIRESIPALARESGRYTIDRFGKAYKIALSSPKVT